MPGLKRLYEHRGHRKASGRGGGEGQKVMEDLRRISPLILLFLFLTVHSLMG